MFKRKPIKIINVPNTHYSIPKTAIIRRSLTAIYIKYEDVHSVGI